MARRRATQPGAYIMSAAASRLVDRVATTRYKLHSLVLMENAAHGATRLALAMLDFLRTQRCVIVCGPGNNGGDGLAMARLLHNAGASVEVLLPADASTRTSKDHAAQRRILRAMGIAMRRWRPKTPLALDRALLIDALYGTGLSRPILGDAEALVALMHSARGRGSKVLALDVPSGIAADTGRPIVPGGACVQADTTATFGALKLGMMLPSPRSRREPSPFGIVHVIDIGVPRAVLQELGRPATSTQLRRVGVQILGGTRFSKPH
jgi:ADP-dependent NAD(P)H-hydrate dehydratase / NAD(P)H-hydrate epimerase